MADPLRPTEGHKRSKSSLAMSFLHREKSKTEDHDASKSSAFAGSSSNASLGTFNSAQAQPQESESTRFTAGMSIEQSVKAFKIFELLRNGDSEAISKAIQESGPLQGTSVLHLAIQCADPAVVEQVLRSGEKTDVNAQDKDGNTPIHLASTLGRVALVQLLLDHKADTTNLNYQGQSPLDLARTPEIFQLLQLDRAMFTEHQITRIQSLVSRSDYEGLEAMLEDARPMSVIDINAMELASEPNTVESGGNLLHEAARRKDMKLIQLLLLNGADPFRRDKRGRLPKDVTKDDKTRAILKKSPAATAAQRGIQEKAILGNYAGDRAMGKDSREIKGYLKKWTNYTSGYKLRWFVLEDGVLSYYKHQDDAGSACRGAMNMRIAKLSMDSQEKSRFEIVGKSSVKYHLKANHEVEAKRWFWALNNAIQWAKDEARDEQQRASREADAARQAISEQRARESTSLEERKLSGPIEGARLGDKSLVASSAIGVPKIATKSTNRAPTQATSSIAGDENSIVGSYEASVAANQDIANMAKTTVTVPGELDEDDEYGDDASSRELRPASKDAFAITAHSAELQLDILLQVSKALHDQIDSKPDTKISESNIEEAVSTYSSAVQSLRSMVGDLQRISRDRDAYWQYRVDRETDMRRMWEESMAKVVKDQEELEGRIGESEEKRKRTKKALREALEEADAAGSRPVSAGLGAGPQLHEETRDEVTELPSQGIARRKSQVVPGIKRKSTIATLTDLSDSDSDLDEEFFDAVGAGEVPITKMPLPPPPPIEPSALVEEEKEDEDEDDQPRVKHAIPDLKSSFVGYEDPVRTRLRLDADNRPKISLWGILKSMIGKDMTKMTLPVSFNEPTSLLQRVAEDMEYTDLLDTAADRADSSERMVYVAAFAASEYASTIGRVAKPFNPLLGETYEYARPDKGYRFLVEQVSHHPPIGAAWAESAKWDYYGESAVKSKFYGKSFDINPLGTWFLKLRPMSGGEELYTWKKVTSSVIGIITGSPTVDNYGPMEIKNWTTGEVCILDFKPRGWKASSAFQVAGKVIDVDGNTRWSIGGRWNDKIFARLTPGYETPAANLESVSSPATEHQPGSNQAFLVWQAHSRPTGIPFNLTPFVVTLNALPEHLKLHLPQTDTRLRPDQRAMEDGEYDFAATEKNRVEEKQREKRRTREATGMEHVPRWFKKTNCLITGEEYWHTDGEYWSMRSAVTSGKGEWKEVDDIF